MKTDLKHAPRDRVAHRDDDIPLTPPNSVECEECVLSCILQSPNEAMAVCVSSFKAGSEVFYTLKHQTIYATMADMYERREQIDVISLMQSLKDLGLLEQIGGMQYLGTLPDKAPAASTIDYYAGVVREKYLLRKMVMTCRNIIGRVYTHTGEVDELIDAVEREMHEVSADRITNEAVQFKDLIPVTMETIESLHERKGEVTGLATGFYDFDKMTGGLKAGEMIVIAARPSMGKTSLAMNIAENIVLQQKLPVGVFSLEMTKESLALRTMCCCARVNLRNIAEGFVAERDFGKLVSTAGKLAATKLFIDDTAGLSILQLRARARRMASLYGIKLFVIDYLQLLHSTSHKARNNRQQEIADISNGIKALAKELQVPVIVLSQLNRELDKEKNRKPRLSDLRESGAIEQDADLVGLLYKPKSDKDDDDATPDPTEAILTNLLIAKQRNGPTGIVSLTFMKAYTRFESASNVSDADVPTGQQEPELPIENEPPFEESDVPETTLL